MEQCKHEIAVKQEGYNVVTYCDKCGKIFEIKPAHNCKPTCSTFENGMITDNCGQILHD